MTKISVLRKNEVNIASLSAQSNQKSLIHKGLATFLVYVPQLFVFFVGTFGEHLGNIFRSIGTFFLTVKTPSILNTIKKNIKVTDL